jgi:hypothetical protein
MVTTPDADGTATFAGVEQGRPRTIRSTWDTTVSKTGTSDRQTIADEEYLPD